MSKIKYSVVIPVYNRGIYELCDTCINSIMSSYIHTRHLLGDVLEVEVIIVNDCSTREETSRAIELARSYNRNTGFKVKYTINAQNYGCFWSRVEGWKLATGDYVINLDSDNSMKPEYLYKLTKEIQNNPKDMYIITINAYSERGKFWDTADYSYYKAFKSLRDMFYTYGVFVDNSIESKIISKSALNILLNQIYNKINKVNCLHVNMMEDFTHTLIWSQRGFEMKVIDTPLEWCYCDTGNMSDATETKVVHDITDILNLYEELSRIDIPVNLNESICTRLLQELVRYSNMPEEEVRNKLETAVGSFILDSNVQVTDPTI